MKKVTIILLVAAVLLTFALFWMRGQYFAATTSVQLAEAQRDLANLGNVTESLLDSKKTEISQLQHMQVELVQEYEKTLEQIEVSREELGQYAQFIYSYPPRQFTRRESNFLMEEGELYYGDLDVPFTYLLNVGDEWSIIDAELTTNGKIVMLLTTIDDKEKQTGRVRLTVQDVRYLSKEPTILLEDEGSLEALRPLRKPITISPDEQFIILDEIGWGWGQCKIFSLKTLKSELRPFKLIQKQKLLGKVKFIGFEPETDMLVLQIGEGQNPNFLKYNLSTRRYMVFNWKDLTVASQHVTPNAVFIIGKKSADKTLSIYRNFNGLKGVLKRD